jgi:hypothetical protein
VSEPKKSPRPRKPTPIAAKRKQKANPPPETPKDLEPEKSPGPTRPPGAKILQVIAAATVGYAVAMEGAGVLLATESLEYTLAMVAELFTGRSVARLELVFGDEVT